MNKLVRIGAMGLALVGCGTDEGTKQDGPEVLPNLEVPDPPARGLQVITPIVHDLAPGTDTEICTWTDAVVGDVVDIKKTLAFQTEPGHHTIVFYTLDKQPPGTQRVCTDNDMASFRFLAGNAGNGIENVAPGNLVYRIPKGAQIVVNHHYLNATDETMNGQSLVNISYADEGGSYVPSGSTAFLNSALDVAQGISQQKQHCVIQNKMKIWYFAPHMHRWGTNIKVDLTQNGSKQRLFDTNWDPSFTFHPPEMRMDPNNPKVLNPGDELDIECNWNNDTGRNLPFGFEMCVAFGQFVDDTNMGNIACDGDHWTDF